MGRYKELFVDYKTMTSDEIAAHQALLVANSRGSGTGQLDTTTQKTGRKENHKILKYKKGFSPEEREMWRGGLKNNRFVTFHSTHANVIKYQLSYDETVRTYSFAREMVKKVNLRLFLGLDVRRGKNFDCPIIAGNIASVNYDRDGNWKYFSRNKENTEGYAFDIIDLMQILYGLTYYEAFDKLCNMLLITVQEAEWRHSQKRKYANNIAVIQRADSTLATSYTDLHRFIKRHLYLLDEMNRIGLANIVTEDESVEGESVFFSSTRHIAERLAARGISKDHTMVDRLLNMFASLGLIKKVHAEQLPDHLESRATEQITNEKYHYHVNFYVIPPMTSEVLIEANRRAILLKKAGIKATGINVDNVGKILGYEVLKAVYGNDDRRSIIRGIKHIRRENWLDRKTQRHDVDESFDHDPFEDDPF